MAQTDVLELLEKTNKWLTTSQISKALNASMGSTTTSLRQLRKFNLVEAQTLYKRSDGLAINFRYHRKEKSI